ncbi:MAG: hypothetical protein LC792_14070, partial [Actinobacteria bacterium]|nr:hypothetical protein [Actinomycetota bacterium]
MWKAAAAVRLPLRRALRRSLVMGGLGVTLATLVVASGTANPLPTPSLELIRWTGGAAGGAKALAQSLPQPAAPTPVVNGPQVTVSWSATTMSGGSPVPGYVVRRYDTNNNLQTIGSNCSGTISTTSCAENSVTTGQWRYTVQAVVGSAWAGQQSAQSATVTVSAATLAFTSSTTITTLPVT